jgi:hypothetical protein
VSSSALLKLYSFHRDLYSHALEAARHFNSLNTAEIASYSQSFQDSLPSHCERTQVDDIMTASRAAQFLLFGDFHTLRQSQRSFLRTLRQLHDSDPERPICVALEMFLANDQPLIDAFLDKRISEAEFLKKIDYYNKWGFPWENYRPIIEYCVQNRIPILGINSDFDSPNRLIRRDEFAARILNQWAHHHPQHLCLCLIGEYHLANNHLLAGLEARQKTIRIVVNVDEYALRPSNHPFATTEYLRLDSNFYCILDTAPWIKWQSLAMWEELHGNLEHTLNADDFDPYTEHHYDFDYQLLHIIRSLNDLLQLGMSSSELSHFDLYVRPDRATLQYIRNKLNLERWELQASDRRILADGFYYFSPSKTIVLNELSINRFAEIAGHYLYNALRHQTAIQPGNTIQSRMERQVCGTLAALLMNPRRPTLRSEDLQDFYNSVKRRRLVGEARQRRDASKAVLPLLSDATELQSSIRSLRGHAIEDKDRKLSCLISRQTGEALAGHLFPSLLQGSESDFLENLRKIFTADFQEQVQILRRLQQMPHLPRSAS